MHSGHRDRLRRKFMEMGVDSFEDHEILELILFYAIPRKNTNEIAHELLETFGSIPSVLNASVSNLKKVNGISDSTAVFIKALTAISRLYIEKQYDYNLNIDNKDTYFKLVSKFIGRSEEVMAMMLFDAKGKLIYDGIVNKGSINGVDIYIRKIMEIVILYNASSAIIAHNHPSGLAEPSLKDIEVTKKLNDIFNSIGVKLIDHLIVADGKYISVKECNLI